MRIQHVARVRSTECACALDGMDGLDLETRLADLPVRMEAWSVRSLECRTRSGWRRRTTELVLTGAGASGRGEHAGFDLPRGDRWWRSDRCVRWVEALRGERRAGDWFRAARDAPTPSIAWALESAAVSLGLAQVGTGLAAWAECRAQPVRYVVSLSLGRPPSVERLR
ncbi:MAG: hypothetical protein AAFZ65_13075, partial [Planctomycetota bacterium]